MRKREKQQYDNEVKHKDEQESEIELARLGDKKEVKEKMPVCALLFNREKSCTANLIPYV